MLTETEDYMIYHNGEAASITIVTELLKHNMKIQISTSGQFEELLKNQF